MGLTSVAARAQDAQQPPPQSPPSSGGWRKFGQPPAQAQPAPPDAAQPDESQNQAPPDQPAPASGDSEYIVPAQLTLKPGTFVTVRIDQALSSDRNQPGDGFSATLVKPIVVDGIVVARPGQTAGGRVVEAEKAGRVSGTSRLKIQLTDLTMVDGQPVTIQSQLISVSGPTSNERDAGAIAGTTAMGAAIGAAAGWGRGAAIGAGAGALVGVVGVLLTRGHATVIYPESVITFRIETPVTISTARAPQSFRYMDPNEYDRPASPQVRMRTSAPPPPPPPPYYYGPAYPPYYYYGPYFYPSGFFFGTGFYYGPRFHRGFWR